MVVPMMALSRVEERIERIVELLKDANAKSIALVGQPGVGKTWMARKTCDRASVRGLFDFILWIPMNREYNSMALLQSFAQQLCLASAYEEYEDDDYEEEDDYNVEEDQKEQVLLRMISQALSGKRFLLVLDDEGKTMGEMDIMPKIETMLNLTKRDSYEVLVTTSVNVDSNMISMIKIEPLSKEESLFLLRELSGGEAFELPGIEPLVNAYVDRSMGLPAAIVVIAKALNYFCRCKSGLQTLELALDKVGYGESFDITPLLSCGYDRIPSSILIDFNWNLSKFFGSRGSVHFIELIAYWIMEGYLGQVDSIEKAYEEGYRVLVEIVDFGLLKTAETDYVVMARTPLNLDACSSYRYGSTASLGLANAYISDKWEGFGRLTLVDGNIRSVFCSKKERKLSTLLVDGNFLARGVPDYFLWSEDHQVLAVFNPTFTSWPLTLLGTDKFNMLVLRGCHFLENIGTAVELRRLTVLEISGPSPICEIPDDFFRHMPLLQSLNLSRLPLASLPSSVYDLDELRFLILRECSVLKSLNSVRRLRNLEVLDVSGSTSLLQIQDKSFSNKCLKVINFSNSKIRVLPLINHLSELTHILLSGCQYLDRMRSISSLSSLQVLDLSHAHSISEVYNPSLEGLTDLKIFDLSETAITKLPFNIGNPLHLYLRGCTQLNSEYSHQCIQSLRDLETLDLSNTIFDTLPPLSHLCNLRRLLVVDCLILEKVPDLNPLKKLETLDLSGCTALKLIHDKSFDQMSRLNKLDLSETKIAHLPSLSNLINLRHLLLKQCAHLEALPKLESLSKLEELNLSGVSCVNKARADFLKEMSHLQILDLSETFLEQLPPMSNLKNLRELYLKGCVGLNRVPDLEVLTKLEVLDLSGTAVTQLPGLQNFSNLRQLMLQDCSCLKEFKLLEVLDVLGGTVKELPYEISELTHLERLELPFKTTGTGDHRNINRIKEELESCDWGILSLSAEVINNPPIVVNGILFLQLLEKDQSLWDTSFKNFHFSIRPFVEQKKESGLRFRGESLIFREIYFLTRHLNDFKEHRSLEVCGFPLPHKDFDVVLRHADYIFFIDNTCGSLISAFGSSNLNGLKSCSIERCIEMESIFHEVEVEEIANMGNTLEVFSVSNAINLRSIWGPYFQSEVLENLTRLYLDCCPNLLTVFSSSQLPKNLKVIDIKFCDGLQNLFEQTSEEPELLNLETLHLWELPELKSIGGALPSLQTLKIHECPNLQKLEETIELAKSLQTLWITNVCDLKSILSRNLQSEIFINLRHLTLHSCPMLKKVLFSSKPPNNLETLLITTCDRLETVFELGIPEYTLPKLRKMHLQDLPKLETIGVILPSSSDCIIINCPNYKTSECLANCSHKT